MIKKLAGLTALSVFLAASAVSAQPVNAPANPNRAALEQQFRERSARVAQQKLRLTDGQLAQLEESALRPTAQSAGGAGPRYEA